jgi:hypothetical protein
VPNSAGSTSTPNLVKKVCPSNYYCPVGSKDKINCTDDHICPEKSIRPVSCPYGSFIKSNLNRTALKNIDDACYFCERGYYAGETTCLPCPAGYICLGKTIAKYPVNVTTDNGYECPPGYYCPEKSLIEQPCPIASYRNTKKGKSLADCYVCPENTFSDKIGQPSCKKCGPSAVSPRNSTTCTCLGSKREFFKSDSSCRCISGFYQVKYGITGKQDDSILDCEPHVYDTCPTGQIYNYEGKCVAKENCATQCRGSGKYSDKFGVCICDSLDKIDVLCDKSCREAASKVIVTASNITVTNPKNTSETLVLSFKEYSLPLSLLVVSKASSRTASI